MGKKFIDKKKSATFCLLARDSSDPIYTEDPENDRVFVRVDNNPVSIRGIGEDVYEDDHENDPDSIFADAPDDVDYCVPQSTSLPDHVRREILELGFPDDGYNYLTHLREIRNTGGGSAYYDNPKANLHDVPEDVKAYDASRVRVAQVSEETTPKTLYNVAQKSKNVRIQKAVDPDIAKLLDEAESDFGSDADGLEEDFVVKANICEETGDVLAEDISASVSEPEDEVLNRAGSEISQVVYNEITTNFAEGGIKSFTEKPRVQRLLDQQFDLLESQEYGTDSDDEYDGLIAKEDISLSEKLNNALKDRKLDDLEIDESYKAPAVEIARRCVEYAENYENEEEDGNELVIVEESSDESENFDCETIVSTYSNLDNHPGRINAPEYARKNRLAETISGALKSRTTGHMISLGGKDKLPVDYLPNGRKAIKEKPKSVVKTELPKRKSHGEESKEEKKERKAAVKEEKREARRLKKELKGVYRGEATRAQKVAADSGPSSIHLN
ncbi:hypothetical protein RND81_06G058600 [Saponaria officinalis]|uniref:Low temperature viability protein n=1 Tax=Saponaria officinalis TaxID=3572 RepID=A0AAW1K476_SAPOF